MAKRTSGQKRKLDILLTNNTMAMYAGSEVATYSFAVELHRRGHTVSIYAPIIGGGILEDCQKAGIPVSDVIERDDYDVAHLHHLCPALYADIRLQCPKVFTCHGIIGDAETAPRINDTSYVAVSEEVQELMQERDDVEATVIRNAIDLERYRPTRAPSKEIKRVLLSTNYYDVEQLPYKEAERACAAIGAELVPVGRFFGNWGNDMVEHYNAADAVLTLGRGILEAMACNRPAIVYGHWGMDGYVDGETYQELRKRNFSGRCTRQEPNADALIEQLQKCDLQANHRAIIEKHHDIKRAVDAYLKLYRQGLRAAQG